MTKRRLESGVFISYQRKAYFRFPSPKNVQRYVYIHDTIMKNTRRCRASIDEQKQPRHEKTRGWPFISMTVLIVAVGVFVAGDGNALPKSMPLLDHENAKI